MDSRRLCLGEERLQVVASVRDTDASQEACHRGNDEPRAQSTINAAPECSRRSFSMKSVADSLITGAHPRNRNSVFRCPGLDEIPLQMVTKVMLGHFPRKPYLIFQFGMFGFE